MSTEMDRADRRNGSRGAYSRRIKLPGKPETYAATDPKKIAAELRANSELGRLERKFG